MLLFISTLIFYLKLADGFGNTNVCHTECTLIRDCPAALGLVSQRTSDIDQIQRELLQQTFCGFENNKPKVCCDIIKIILHPNLNLLPSECGFIDGNKIYGGTTTGINEFPWMALISVVRKDGNQFACAGSIISSRYILTAAHCVNNMEVAGVRVGDHDLRTDDDCEWGSDGVVCLDPVQDIGVESIIVHEDYIQTGKFWKHDIALLRLETPIDPKRRNARPVCLPISVDEQQRQLDGLKATIVGWGITEDGAESQVLKKAEIPILSSDVCYLFFESKHVQERFRTHTESFFCAGVVGKDTCRRDSGGPLIVSGKHGGFNRYIQYGITSFGIEKCGADKPGLYTDVLTHLTWILNNMSN